MTAQVRDVSENPLTKFEVREDDPGDEQMETRQGLTLVHFSPQPKPFWSLSRFVPSL
jgi:hypothetical protein